MVDLDLHIHSVHSDDGEFEVREIVEKCVSRGLRVFSLTDHNSVQGVAQAAACAEKAGIGFIPGIEIDCCYAGTDMHLLGYGVEWRSADFAHLEKSVRGRVTASFDQMIDNLLRLGFVIDAQAVLAAAGDKLPSGELIAEVMLSDSRYDSPLLAPYQAGGSRSDMPYINFYLDYFAQGRPAYVPVEYIDFREAVELVRDNRGIPIVAHPGLNFRGREQCAEQLLDRGAAGLEVFNNYHMPPQADYFAGLVRNKGAFMTCGSDFHGKNKPLIQIGQFCSDSRFSADLQASATHLEARGRKV